MKLLKKLLKSYNLKRIRVKIVTDKGYISYWWDFKYYTHEFATFPKGDFECLRRDIESLYSDNDAFALGMQGYRSNEEYYEDEVDFDFRFTRDEFNDIYKTFKKYEKGLSNE